MDVIEVMMEAGMWPADEHHVDWVAERWDGVSDAKEAFGCYVVAGSRPDELVVQVTTLSGVISAEIRFSAPDGEVSKATAAAAIATIFAWSA